ncbi:MAG TPA: hypothetical protein VGM18_08505 [Candidatus Sulfotelmatobacter sp.]
MSQYLVVVGFGFRAGPVEREIPSTSLRAGSSHRLKYGFAQDVTTIYYNLPTIRGTLLTF